MPSDETYGDYEEQYRWEEWHKTFQCPNGHGQMTYWEGTIDQDRQGNNIDGCNHYCPECGYESKLEEL